VRPVFPRPPRFPALLIAHRGVPAAYPENTLPSFEAAIAAGADVLEFDVQPSADGALVVVHDETLDRTTSGRGPVREMTLDRIRALDAGAWYDERFAGLRVPTLEEALDAAGGRVVLNLELKQYGPADPSLAERTYAAVASRGLTDSVLFSSFHFELLRRLRELDHGVPIAALFHFAEGRRPVAETVALGARFLGCHHRLVTERRMAEAKRADLLVCPYTVNARRQAARLLDLGVAGLITNDLPGLLGYYSQRYSRS
jgi:glycerophosphoryl diester phosphodiesterase